MQHTPPPTIQLRIAQPGDTAHLQLRPEDATEVSPAWAAKVESEIAAGRAVAAWEGPELVALCGAAPGHDFLSPWLLASPAIEKHSRTVMRHARQFVADLRSDGRALVGNHIGKNAAANRAFVQALGFVIVASPGGSHDFFYLPKNHV